MSNMDYFQPLDKHVRVPLWSETLKDEIRLGTAFGAYLSVILFVFLLPTFFNSYPHIEQSLDSVGYGVIRACRPDCGHCEQDWHRHYQKAWGKVK